MLTRTAAFVKQVIRGFIQHSGGMMAAAISYYALLSLVPLLLLGISLLGFILRSSDLGLTRTVDLVRTVLPANQGQAQSILNEVHTILRDITANWPKLGVTGLIFLIWTGSNMFHVLEEALNRTWGAARSRPYWKGRLLALLLMACTSCLLMASVLYTIITQWLRARQIPGLHETLGRVPIFWNALDYAVPCVISIITFGLIYYIMPNARVTWREALIGGVFAGVLWEAAKVGFGAYVATFGARNYNRVYGSLASAVIVVLWIYYTANILVIGGEVARAWCDWITPTPAPRRTRGPRARRDSREKRPRRIRFPWRKRGEKVAGQ